MIYFHVNDTEKERTEVLKCYGHNFEINNGKMGFGDHKGKQKDIQLQKRKRRGNFSFMGLCTSEKVRVGVESYHSIVVLCCSDYEEKIK